MGVRCSFNEITPSAFEAIVRGESSRRHEIKRHSIDKAWMDFHMVFSRQPYPLKLMIVGDYVDHDMPMFEMFWEGKHDVYFGYASPKLVREIAEVLRGVTKDKLQAWYIEFNCGEYDRDFCFSANLRSAYDDAAHRGNGLEIIIA